MWCKQCQQDVRAIMLPTEMGNTPHCPRCGELLRLATPRSEAIAEMAEASGDLLLARRGLPISLVSKVRSEHYDTDSITITAPRGGRRADISIDWQWDEDRRALRRLNAALEGGSMYRFDRGHLPTATPSETPIPDVSIQPVAKPTSQAAGGLLFAGLAMLSAGAAFFAHGLWASTPNALAMPLVIAGQTLVTFSLLFQMDSLRRSGQAA